MRSIVLAVALVSMLLGSNAAAKAPRGREVASVVLPSAVRLEGRDFVRAVSRRHGALSPTKRRWNVLLLIMESTGLSYALKPQLGKLAMPFTVKLAKEGLNLTHHFSPANTSPRSVAALFTGLYPMPERKMYAMSRGLHLPTTVTHAVSGKGKEALKRRYLNNLYLLDRQLERMVETLKQMKALDRTIIVLVGDHGEAWGQHPGNYEHSKASYNENYQTPAIFWQPKLFAPREVKVPTTHVDIVPTLLDAAGIRYNRKLLQGESLLRGKLERRYVFLVGKEGVISSVSHAGVKLQIKLLRGGNKCWVYDLAKDPGETQRRSCSEYPRHSTRRRGATARSSASSSGPTTAYNDACKRKQAYRGQRHPPPR